jgi:hypothetical protein
VADRLQVELAAALLEKILETLAKEVHNHNMVLFAFVGFFISHVMEAGDASLSAELVNQFALPEKHNVLLRFFGFFLQLQSVSGRFSEKLAIQIMVNSNLGI